MSDYSPEERISHRPSSEEPEHKSRKGIIIALIFAVIVIAAIVIAVILLKPDKPEEDAKEDSNQARSMVVTNDNVDQILADSSDSVGVGSYRTVMNTTWRFENGQSASSNAYVENSASNSNAVYLDVKLTDTGEIIYSSPIIPVGSHLENIALDKELAEGTYPCRVTYNLVDENQKVISTVDVNLTIVVEH